MALLSHIPYHQYSANQLARCGIAALSLSSCRAAAVARIKRRGGV